MTDDPTAELRALAHPLRLRILSLLTGQAMSAAEVARALGCTQANASYHLRLLASIGKVVVAESLRDHSHPGHMTDAELWLTPQAWASFCDTVLDAAIRLHADAQPSHAPGTIRTSTTISLFRMVEE